MWKTYKLSCSKTDKVYYGSTKLSLVERCGGHRNSGECESRTFVKPIIGLMDVFATKKEALEAERKLIEENPCVNKRIPIKSKEEKEKYKAEWYVKNAERISDKGKQVVQCKCGMTLKRSSLSNHRKTQFHITNAN